MNDETRSARPTIRETTRDDAPHGAEPTAYGVFKPVGHVVIALAPGTPLEQACSALRNAGFIDEEMRAYTPQQMAAQADRDIERAGFLATVGQELNLVRAHRDLAAQGSAFVVVRTRDDERAGQAATVARALDARRAQLYGRFVVEELIPVGTTAQQVFESPDRGLDAQTRTGHEGDVGGSAAPRRGGTGR